MSVPLTNDPRSLIPLAGSLGSAAAAVIVTFLFIGFIRDTVKDRSAIIHEVSVALDKNTQAITKLEETLRSRPP